MHILVSFEEKKEINCIFREIFTCPCQEDTAWENCASHIFKAKHLPIILKTFRTQDKHFERKKRENQDILKTF